MHIAEITSLKEQWDIVDFVDPAASDQTSAAACPACDASRLVEICGEKGGPVFRLHLLDAGIYVERRIATWQRELACYAVFDDEPQFLEWCEADATRLSHPLVHHQLRQAGHDLFANYRCTTVDGSSGRQKMGNG